MDQLSLFETSNPDPVEITAIRNHTCSYCGKTIDKGHKCSTTPDKRLHFHPCCFIFWRNQKPNP